MKLIRQTDVYRQQGKNTILRRLHYFGNQVQLRQVMIRKNTASCMLYFRVLMVKYM